MTPLPIGFGALADFAYSRGKARPAFAKAIAAEKAQDWSAVEAACRAALATDPTHLEAQWLLAMALAAQERYAEVGAPLSAAIAGDWLRWGRQSLEHERFAGYLASDYGPPYRDLVDVYGEQVRHIARSGLWVVGRRGRWWRPKKRGAVSVNHRSEVYAHDLEQGRFVRVSRTNGALVGLLRSPNANEAAFVAYRRIWLPTDAERAAGKRAYLRRVEIGTIDTDGPRMSKREVVFENVYAVELTWATTLPGRPGKGVSADDPALVARTWGIRSGGVPATKPTTYVLDPEEGTATIIRRAPSRWDTLRVAWDSVTLRRGALSGVAADWDDDGTAGALLLERTNKPVAVPDGGSAARDSLRWSSSRLRLAFATVPVDPCSDVPDERHTALYVVDAATGKLTKVADGAHDFAPTWLDDARLAYVAVDGTWPGVRIFDAEAGEHRHAIDTAGGLGTDWLPARSACATAAPPVDASAPDLDVDVDEAWDDDDGV